MADRSRHRMSPGSRWLTLRMAPVVMGAAVFVCLANAGRDVWQGDWLATSARVQYASLVIGPLLAALTALDAGLPRRRGLDDLMDTMPKPVERLVWRHILIGAGVTGMSVASVVAVLAGVTLLADPQGMLWPSWWLGPILVRIMGSTIGAVVGFLVPTWWAPVAAAAAVFGWLAITAVADDPLARFGFVRPDPAFSPDQRLAPTLLLAQLGWVVAVIVALLILVRIVRGGTGSRPSATAGAAAAGLLVVGTAAVVAVPSSTVTRAPVPPACFDGPQGLAEVCVWPEHASVGPVLAAAAERLHTRLGEPWAPARWVEAGLPGAESFRLGPGRDAPLLVSALMQNRVPAMDDACVQADER